MERRWAKSGASADGDPHFHSRIYVAVRCLHPPILRMTDAGGPPSRQLRQSEIARPDVRITGDANDYREGSGLRGIRQVARDRKSPNPPHTPARRARAPLALAWSPAEYVICRRKRYLGNTARKPGFPDRAHRRQRKPTVLDRRRK